MLKHILALALLLPAPSLATAVPTGQPTLCRVTVTSSPGSLLDKRLTARQRPGCQGVAYLRWASRLGGSLPDNPPGRVPLYPGQILSRETPSWWWVEWQDRSGRWWRVPETEAPG